MTCDDQLLPLAVSQHCETRLVLTKCQRDSQEEVCPLRVFRTLVFYSHPTSPAQCFILFTSGMRPLLRVVVPVQSLSGKAMNHFLLKMLLPLCGRCLRIASLSSCSWNSAICSTVFITVVCKPEVSNPTYLVAAGG